DNVPTQLGDRLELGLPHRMVEGMTVYQEQRLPAAADLFESEIDSVQEGFLHCESRREMWGAKLSIDPRSVQSIYCTRCNLPITSSLPLRLRETSVRAGSVRAIGYPQREFAHARGIAASTAQRVYAELSRRG